MPRVLAGRVGGPRDVEPVVRVADDARRLRPALRLADGGADQPPGAVGVLPLDPDARVGAALGPRDQQATLGAGLARKVHVERRREVAVVERAAPVQGVVESREVQARGSKRNSLNCAAACAGLLSSQATTTMPEGSTRSWTESPTGVRRGRHLDRRDPRRRRRGRAARAWAGVAGAGSSSQATHGLPSGRRASAVALRKTRPPAMALSAPLGGVPGNGPSTLLPDVLSTRSSPPLVVALGFEDV